MTPEEPDYQQELEQHEFIKSQGIEAWTESIADMLPNCDPDKRILIKEGMKALLQGPPSFRVPPMTFSPPPNIDVEFVQPPSHIFEHTDEDGTVTCWDWHCLASRGTHSSKKTDGTVQIWKGSELVIALTGEPATKFWEWKTSAVKFYGAPVMMRRPS